MLYTLDNNITEEVIIINNCFVNQTENNDCGLACLAMILKYFKIDTSLKKLKNSISYKNEMLSVYEIIKLSKKYGVLATGYKNVDINDLKFPCIIHVIKNEKQHFVTLFGKKKNKFLQADPSFLRTSYINYEDLKNKYTGVAIFFEKNNDIMSSFFKNKILILKSLFLFSFITLLNILCSFFIPVLLNLKMNNKKLSLILTISLLFFTFQIIKDLMNYFKDRYLVKLNLLVDKFVTMPTINKIINLPHKFYHYNSSGELISKINDLSYIKEGIYVFLNVIVINVMFIIIILTILLFKNILVFLSSIIFILVIYILNKNFMKNNLNKVYELQCLNENMYDKLSSTFSAILMIKNLSKENYFIKNINITHKNMKKMHCDFMKKQERFNLISSFIITIMLFLVVLTLLLQNVKITDILIVFSLFQIIIDSSTQISKQIPLYQDLKAAYLRINEIYQKNELKKTNERIDINKIEIKNLSFSYENNVVLKEANLNIYKGDWVFINGITGSGKSTLFKILTKQIEFDCNSIFINKISLNDIEEEVIRNSIMYVDQKLNLFNASIKENIFMGDTFNLKPVKAALVDEMLELNKIDYDYKINSTNSNLSGGQISKIIIAQALNSKRNFIIFDETTSNLDINTERRIYDNIKRKYKDKTIIVITHRKSNIDYFNKIFLFNDGKIIKLKKRGEML